MEQKPEYAVGDFVKLELNDEDTTGVIVQKIIQPREIRVTYWFADEYKYLVSVPEFGGDYKWLNNDEIQGMFTKLPIEYKLSLISKFGGWWYSLHKKIYFTLLIEALH